MTTGSEQRERSKASTADILTTCKTQRIDPTWREHYLELMELRTLLQKRQVNLAADAMEEQPAYSEHMGDAGTDQYDQDFALSMLSSDQSALCEIDEAINRIRSGTYGICEISGKPIEPERLLAIPWTRYALESQQSLEREGVVARTQFAPRRALVEMGAQEESADPAEEV